jgi:pilus assembly protein Flp/PilA
MQADQERGQGLAEYGLILVIVAVIIIVLLWIFGGQVGRMFSNIILMI